LEHTAAAARRQAITAFANGLEPDLFSNNREPGTLAGAILSGQWSDDRAAAMKPPDLEVEHSEDARTRPSMKSLASPNNDHER
jgi:hypothetical protein